ncbi:MAG: redox-sensing transcriptional repressor Rex [Candidatus Sumerlaeaceae bacterium]|nr:redox-sensing transcriptional repressor Rex [Candidatus Sumerlaeaceae bacterium]
MPADQHPTAPVSPQDALARIPKAAIKRLSLYTRVLQNLEMNNVEKVSSHELAEHLGLNSAQVRKDLAYYGQFGVPGFGYYVADLRANLKRILGTDKEIRVALVGVGNLGSALMSYGGFLRQGFKIALAFDVDGRKVGAARGNVPIDHIDDLEKRIRAEGIEIAILSVPAEVAQSVVDRLVAAGVTGILNFVPLRLIAPEHVKVQYVDLAIEIESLSYYLR